jgi:hypothetical protein
VFIYLISLVNTISFCNCLWNLFGIWSVLSNHCPLCINKLIQVSSVSTLLTTGSGKDTNMGQFSMTSQYDVSTALLCLAIPLRPRKLWLSKTPRRTWVLSHKAISLESTVCKNGCCLVTGAACQIHDIQTAMLSVSILLPDLNALWWVYIESTAGRDRLGTQHLKGSQSWMVELLSVSWWKIDFFMCLYFPTFDPKRRTNNIMLYHQAV